MSLATWIGGQAAKAFFALTGKKPIEQPQNKITTMPIDLITPKELESVTDTLSLPRCTEMATLINELCNKYGIVEKLPFEMFLSNCLQESGEFSHKQENMNYSAARIVAVWPSRFPNLAAAQPYARNPQALAEKVYMGRMGNNVPGDGFRFKGAGFIGITGRELYEKYANYINKPVEEAANLINTTDRYSLDSACWFFAIYKKLIPVALKGNFVNVCRLINTGSIKRPAIGQDVRDRYYKRIQALNK